MITTAISDEPDDFSNPYVPAIEDGRLAERPACPALLDAQPKAGMSPKATSFLISHDQRSMRNQKTVNRLTLGVDNHLQTFTWSKTKVKVL